ncbi:MAG: FAD-dependent monooxygenase [Candidatus Thiodiazotropha sp.]
MYDDNLILIIGAGPVGLSAALELARAGKQVRILDENRKRSEYSKAMGINSRTLELLEPSGVTARLLKQGIRIPGVQFGTSDKTRFRIDFSRNGHRYNYMLGLPQSETERILEQRLREFGVRVERNHRFRSLQQTDDGVLVTVQSNGDRFEQIRAAYLIGADGAHSQVRHALGIDFPGTSMKDRWSLADLRIPLADAHEPAGVLFQPDGVLFMLQFQPGILRVASNHPDVLERLPDGLKVEQVLWQSEFHVSHRQVPSYRSGRVFLAGDAAHIHSPLGGRGMNMGIEDACTLAKCLTHGEADLYSESRHRVGASAIRLIKLQTLMATSQALPIRIMRNWVLPWLLRVGPLHKALSRRMLGLDYAERRCDPLSRKPGQLHKVQRVHRLTG